ncbi:spore cortex-lytic enzyme [Fictibacillus sp. Mic-4]|uniref:spore cortex-lytic enzyme n=1 Tax=Fictibacillus TaxID=1329200 RepID=UPI000429FFB0|nr:spore cortex-lytic enzyme [Fictibacillus gelatini]
MKGIRHYIKRLLILVTFCFLVLADFPNQAAHAFTPQVIQKGAVGEDVIELQARLQYIGYYNGPIDGVFGWRTYWALRNFQYEFKLPVDGLAGYKTKIKLASVTKFNRARVMKLIRQGRKFTTYGGVSEKKQTGNVVIKGRKKETKQPERKQAKAQPGKNTPAGFSQNDINLLANAVYGEARGEPYIGQVAIAAVILNRLHSPAFPNTVAGVIFEPRAFTAVADGQIYLTPNKTAKKAVMDAINGWDPTGEALYYFNPDTATSGWIWTRPQIKKIGKHIFCK